MRKLILILACLLSATVASAQSNMGGGGGSSSSTTSSPTFVTGATADYRPILQTSGSILTDYVGSNSVTFATSGTCPANPTFLATGGLNFVALSSQCLGLPAALNNLAVEITFNMGDPGPNNSGNNNSAYNVILGGSAATTTIELGVSNGGGGTARSITGMFMQPVGGSGTASLTTDALIGTHQLVYVPGTPDKFYIDGQQVTNCQNFSCGSTAAQVASGVLQLGGSNAWVAGSFFNGVIYQTRFLPVATATAKNILQDYFATQALLAANGVQLSPTVGLGLQGLGQAASTANIHVLDGDSITWGTGVTVDMSHTMNVYGPNTDIRNAGYPSLQGQGIADDLFSTLAPYYRPLAGVNSAQVWYGINDLAGGQSPQQVFATVLQGCRVAHLYGFRAFAGTLLSNTGVAEAKRDQTNTMIRNGAIPTCDDVIDYAANVTLGADGANTGGGFQGDHAHPTQTSVFQIMAPTASAHYNYLQGPLGTAASGAPRIFKSGAATIPQIIQWNQPNSTNCSNASAASPTCAFWQPVSVGSTTCIWFLGGTTATTVSSVTDTLSGTYTAVTAKVTNGATWSEEFCAPNSTGGSDTITVNLSGADTLAMMPFEIYGAASASPVDVTDVGRFASSATPNNASLTTTAANDLLVVTYATNSIRSYLLAVGAGYAANSNMIPGAAGGIGYLSLSSQLATTTGTYQGTNATGAGVTPTASVAWYENFMAIKAGTFGSTIQMLPSDCVPSNPCQLDPSGGSFTLNLVDAVIMAGEKYSFTNIANSPSANTVTLAAINSQTINGVANFPVPFGKTVTCTAVLVSASAAGANWLCSVPGPQTVALTAQYTNSTTGFTNVTGTNNLAFQVAPSTTYHIDCTLYYQAAATGGLNIEFTGPASPTAVSYSLNAPLSATSINTAAATAYSTSLGAAVTTATTNFPATVSFDLVNGTTGGTVQLLAKSSAAVQLQIQIGSSCRMSQ